MGLSLLRDRSVRELLLLDFESFAFPLSMSRRGALLVLGGFSFFSSRLSGSGIFGRSSLVLIVEHARWSVPSSSVWVVLWIFGLSSLGLVEEYALWMVSSSSARL